MGKTYFASFCLVLSLACLAQTRTAAPPTPRFEDVTKQAGLTVPHLSSPDKRYILESMSGGVGFTIATTTASSTSLA